MTDQQRPHVLPHPRHVTESNARARHDTFVRELRPPLGVSGRLWFLLDEPDELFIESIKAEGHGWGTAMMLELQAMYPERNRWTAESINVESRGSWDKLCARHGIDLEAGAVRPDGRPQ